MDRTVQTILREATSTLQRSGIDTARLEAEILLAFQLQCERAFFFAHPESFVPPTHLAAFHELIRRRADRCPLQYLTGVQEFFGRRFRVSPAVLIPRPETEILVEAGLEFLASSGFDPAPRVLDMGTGSGCIAATVACECPVAQVTAVDLSKDALAVARGNCRDLGCLSRVRLIAGDTLDPVMAEALRFDLILSNPPYVGTSEREQVAPEVDRFEPHMAVYAGVEGMEIFAALFERGPAALLPGGRLMVEVGYNQAERVVAKATSTGWELLERRRDLAGIERCLVFRRPADGRTEPD